MKFFIAPIVNRIPINRANIIDTMYSVILLSFSMLNIPLLIQVKGEKQLIISTDTYDDITLEKGLLDEKATFFEEVYGISIVIKQRKK